LEYEYGKFRYYIVIARCNIYFTLLQWNVILSFCDSAIIEFPLIIAATKAHIWLKFDIWIHRRIMQARFKFSHGPMDF
jgi:hypothetical protein